MKLSTKEAFMYFGGGIVGLSIASSVINRLVGEDMSKKSMNVCFSNFHFPFIIYCVSRQVGKQKLRHINKLKEWIRLEWSRALHTSHIISNLQKIKIQSTNFKIINLI